MDPSSVEEAKIQQEKLNAATRAVAFVESGMMLGLGSGSTVDRAIDVLARRVSTESLDVTTVVASRRTQERAEAAGIRVVDFGEVSHIDVLIDGADEVDPAYRLIKGGGGALVRERILAAASQTIIIAVDSRKPVERLGRFPLPIAVVPFGCHAVAGALASRGIRAQLRMTGGGVFVTDDGQWVVDCVCPDIDDPGALVRWLKMIPGVVEVGLFLDLVDWLVIARGDAVEVRRAPDRPTHSSF